MHLEDVQIQCGGHFRMVRFTGSISTDSTGGTSTITLNGTSGTQILNGGVSNTFDNFIINNTGDSVRMNTALNVSGDLTISAGILDLNGYDFSLTGALYNSGILQLQGAETVSIGTMDYDSGTVTYVGDGDAAGDTYTIKDFGANDYYHLVINSTDGTTDAFELGENIDTDGDFTITAGTFNTSDGTDRDMDIAGNVDIDGVFTANSSTITASGDWNSSGGTFNYDTSTVNLTGTGNLTSNGNDFYNLTVASAGQTTTLQSHFRVRNICTLGTGTLTGNYRLALYLPVSTTPLVNMGASVSISELRYIIADNRTYTVTGGTYTLSGASGFNMLSEWNDVTFNLDSDLTVNGIITVTPWAGVTITFNTQNNAVTATGLSLGLTGTLSNVAVNSGSSNIDLGTSGLDTLNDSGSHTLNLGSTTVTCEGNWELVDGSGSISQNAGSSTITFDGTTDQTITTGGNAFNDLTFDNPGSSFIINGLLDVDGVLTITDGNLDLDTNDPDVSTAGNVTIDTSGSVTNGTGTWTFDGITNFTDNSSGGPQNLGNVVVD